MNRRQYQKAKASGEIMTSYSPGPNKHIKIYTDGGCLGTPGTGAWAFILKEDGKAAVEDCGGARFTTNNRMEIMAVLKALTLAKTIPTAVSITVYSDSQYVCNSINQWVDGWAKKDFAEKANADLWRHFIRLKQQLPPIEARWVKGHNGHIENERCDTMCNAVYKSTNLAIDEVCKATYDAKAPVAPLVKAKKKSQPKVSRSISGYKQNFKNARRRWDDEI